MIERYKYNDSSICYDGKPLTLKELCTLLNQMDYIIDQQVIFIEYLKSKIKIKEGENL